MMYCKDVDAVFQTFALSNCSCEPLRNFFGRLWRRDEWHQKSNQSLSEYGAVVWNDLLLYLKRPVRSSIASLWRWYDPVNVLSDLTGGKGVATFGAAQTGCGSSAISSSG